MLFVRFGGIGDILCSLPAYEALCGANPDLHGLYITLSEFKCLPGLAKAPGSICGSRKHCSIPELPRSIVAKTFIPHYTDETGKESSHLHLIEEFYRACGLSPTKTEFNFCLHDDEILHIQKLLDINPRKEPLIVVIQTGPSWKVREWPVNHWQKLVDLLHAKLSVRIFQIGSHHHVTMGKVEAATLKGVESLVGKLSLEEIAALLTVADLFIGIDSGMLHMAGGAGTPCLGIFGPTNPDFRIPLRSDSVGIFHELPCSFCHHRQPRLHFQESCPFDILCMKELDSNHVFEKSLSFLEKSKRLT